MHRTCLTADKTFANPTTMQPIVVKKYKFSVVCGGYNAPFFESTSEGYRVLESLVRAKAQFYTKQNKPGKTQIISDIIMRLRKKTPVFTFIQSNDQCVWFEVDECAVSLLQQVELVSTVLVGVEWSSNSGVKLQAIPRPCPCSSL